MSDENALNQPVGFFKRILVIIYDLLLLIALLFAVGVLVAGVITFVLNKGNAITAEHDFYFAFRVIILSSLIFASFLFFGWFWTHKGQTLGMKTWHVRLISTDGSPIDWEKVSIRYITAIISWSVFGLGFLWALVDKDKRAWHDIFSATKLIQLEKK
jgi:uncharacterized RDD family membrane protein YckC